MGEQREGSFEVRSSTDEPKQYLGYKTAEQATDESGHLNTPAVCMVSRVTEENQSNLSDAVKMDCFPVGSWCLIRIDDRGTIHLKGPFDAMEEAMKVGNEKYGVVSFRELVARLELETGA